MAVERPDEKLRIDQGGRERGVWQREDQLISVNVEMKVVLMLRKIRYLATRPKEATKRSGPYFEISRRYVKFPSSFVAC